MKYPPWFFEVLTEVVPGIPTELERFQIAYLLDEGRFKITNKTRQAGGSVVVSMAKFVKAYLNENVQCDIISINREEAQSKIRYIRNFWDSLPPRWKHPLAVDNMEKIAFHSGRNTSVIRSIAASAGVRGGRKDIVFDEAAHILGFAQLFVAALPATVRDEGGFDIVSTPRGQEGRFHEIWANQDGMYSEWSRHQFIWIDVSMFCTDIDAARDMWIKKYGMDPNALLGEVFDTFATPSFKSLASSFTSEEFLQEFCGVFVDEATAVFPYALIDPLFKHKEAQPTNERGDLDTKNVLVPWNARPEDNDHEVIIGIDFAEGKAGGDSTSIQGFEIDADARYRQRFYRDLDAGSGWDNFDSQLGEINDIIKRFRPTRVRVDATSLGRPLYQALVAEHGDALVEGVTFTNQNKHDMVTRLKRLMERQEVWFQHENKRLKGQIHNIKRTLSANRSIQYSGHPHDDMFWAVALATYEGDRLPYLIYT